MLKLLISIVLLLNAQQGYCLKCHTYQCGTIPATTVAPAVVTTAAPAVKAAAAGDTTACPATITLDKLATEDCKAPYDSCVIKTMTSEPSSAIIYTIYGCTEFENKCIPDNNARVDCQKCKTDLCNPRLPVITTIVTNTGTGTGSGGGTNGTEADKGKAGGAVGQHYSAGAAAGFLAVLLAFCF